MRALSHIVPLLLAATMFGMDVNAQQSEYLLAGRVVNGDNDAALTDLTINLFNSQGGEEAITCDVDGRFTATIDRSQFYQLVVHAAGFETQRRMILSCSYSCIDYPVEIWLKNSLYPICGTR